MESLTDKLSYTQREALENLIPELRQLRLKYIGLCEACANSLLTGVGIAKAETERKSFVITMIRRQDELLKANNIDIDATPSEFSCVLCNDKGMVIDNGIMRPCQCRTLRLQVMRNEKFASLPCFTDFDESIFTDEEQRKSTINKKIELEKYVCSFPKNEKPHIILIGNTGLGKTFLLSCLTKGIHEKGYKAEMISAYVLFDSFRKQHLGEAYVLDRLSNLPFLSVDDLGVEPIYRNITVEYFSELLNLRISRNLPIAITTNLDVGNLKERYGERVVSRLFDQKKFNILGLKGNSLR